MVRLSNSVCGGGGEVGGKVYSKCDTFTKKCELTRCSLIHNACAQLRSLSPVYTIQINVGGSLTCTSPLNCEVVFSDVTGKSGRCTYPCTAQSRLRAVQETAPIHAQPSHDCGQFRRLRPSMHSPVTIAGSSGDCAHPCTAQSRLRAVQETAPIHAQPSHNCGQFRRLHPSMHSPVTIAGSSGHCAHPCTAQSRLRAVPGLHHGRYGADTGP